jgi:hypothetical protein
MKTFSWRLAALLTALILVAAACGGGEDDALLPVNDGDSPAADFSPGPGSACAVDEPDCSDTPSPGEQPQGLPSGDVGGFVVRGGLTISEALATDATGVLALQGFLVDDGQQARLCETLAESFPPQCGAASVALDSIDQIDPDELSTEGNVTWTDNPVTVLGELVDGVLVTTSLSQ